MINRTTKISAVLLLLTVIFISIVPTNTAIAEDNTTYITQSGISEFNFDKLDENQMSYDVFGMTFKEKVQTLISGEVPNSTEVYKKILTIVFSSINTLIPMFATVVGLILSYGVLSELKTNYLSSELQKIINICLMIAIMTVIMGSIISFIKDSKTLMISLQNQMYTVFPILLTLMFAVGGKSTVIGIQPILYFLSTIITKAMIGFIFPLFILMTAINMLSSVSNDIKLNRFNEFLHTLTNYTLGIAFTAFTATLSISGIVGHTYDSVLYKTAKYTVGHSVPVIGTYVKDGLDLVIMSSIMIKNSVGIVALLLFLSTVISPIITAFTFSLMLKLVAGITESFCSDSVGKFLINSSKCVANVGVAITTVSLMYMMSIFIMMLTANMVI